MQTTKVMLMFFGLTMCTHQQKQKKWKTPIHVLMPKNKTDTGFLEQYSIYQN